MMMCIVVVVALVVVVVVLVILGEVALVVLVGMWNMLFSKENLHNYRHSSVYRVLRRSFQKLFESESNI